MAKTKFAWHVHHEILVEPLTEPIENRIAYIKKNKPPHEIPIRLTLLHEVKGKLPAAYVKARAASDKARDASVKAWDAYDKAWAAYIRAEDASDKARAACDKARAAYDKAWAACDKARTTCIKAMQVNMPAILKLHEKECAGCTWDGTTIFPEEGSA